MKSMIINTACISCFMLAGLTVSAQQSKAATAQIATESEQKKAAQNSANDLQEPAKPAALPLKKAEATTPVAATAKPAEAQQSKEEMKGMEINPSAQKGKPLQNADRPKASTIQPDTKERPLANEGPKTPDRQQ